MGTMSVETDSYKGSSCEGKKIEEGGWRVHGGLGGT